jgi:agarase
MKSFRFGSLLAIILLTAHLGAGDGTYRVTRDDAGKYWFESPDGELFLSMGINNVVSGPFRPRPNSEYYEPIDKHFGGDRSAWLADVRSTLHDAGMNTIGAWSNPDINDGSLLSTPILYVGGAESDRCFEPLRPGFEEKVRENTRKLLAEHTAVDKIVGFFLDNEMSWYGKSPWDDLPTYTLLEAAFLLEENDPARAAALEFIKERHGDVASFAKAWEIDVDSWESLNFSTLQKGFNESSAADRNDFTAMLAERFYSIASRVVREEAPGKLILGTRFAGIAPTSVIEACGRHCDVVSVNDYRSAPRADGLRLARYYVLGGKPLLITEYSWRGRENTSGNPNTGGAGSVVPTQKDRADNYEKYVADLLAHPMVLGAHWFEFADQSPQGRFDGENSNYGVVDIHNRRYDVLIEAMARANALVADIHRNSDLTAPTEMPQAPKVTYSPGQHPDRPPVLDLLKQAAIAPPDLWKAQDARIDATAAPEGALVLTFDTADQWGCGVSLFGPKHLARVPGPPNTTDLDGYTTIILDATVTKGLRFEVILDEAGAADGDNSAGDDGESFLFPATVGSGTRETYRFEIGSAGPRETWGNQQGARRIDMQAMKALAIYLPGSQGEGEMQLHSIRLER